MSAPPKRVLITDSVFDDCDVERDVLEPHGFSVTRAPSSDPQTLLDCISEGVAGILVCFAPLDEPLVRAAGENGCRVIARYGIGVDNVDLETATELGIQVTNVPDYCLDEVADHTLALLLACARGLADPIRDRGVGSGIPYERIRRLSGRTLGLVGLGGIGLRVAARARAFGLKVLAFDPYRDDWDGLDVEPVASVRSLVAESDYISLHAPLTDETRHVIDADALAAARRQPILINTARGGLVDLDAVLAALESGQLSGAALDVTEPEPLPDDHPLRDRPDVILTPHVAFHSVEASDELQRRATEEVLRVLRGEPPQNPVNRPRELAEATD
jgi:D-3-phosphoglycerate dehydrogenase